MSLDERVAELSALLNRIEVQFAPALLMTSFGAEDMVLIDAIARGRLGIDIATLDTGRLPEQTHDLWRTVESTYARKVLSFHPQAEALGQYIRTNGANAFYDSVAQRMQCCGIRKVEPLGRALKGRAAWITGMRREQAASRAYILLEESDAEHGLVKFNPLADWSTDEVWQYLNQYEVPHNRLHDLGYPSIGCAPCTRAIQAGEDPRAGRWWWEQAGAKECGLHIREIPVAVTA